MQIEGHIANRRRRVEMRDRQQRRPAVRARRRRARIDGPDVPSHHQPHKLRLAEACSRARRGDRAALAHHRDLVGDGEHLLEPVRNKHDGAARPFQPSDDVEQPLDLTRAQRRRRLVENDEVRAEHERLGDFDKLALRRQKVARLGVEREDILLPEIGEDLARAPPHRRARKPAGLAQVGQKDVFQNRKVRREAGLLHDHGDAGVQRLARRARFERPAAIGDLAGVAANMAGNDARQCRFAGAVGAEQRMGRARAQTQARAGEGAGLREILRDIARLQQKVVSHRLHGHFRAGGSPPARLATATRRRTRSV